MCEDLTPPGTASGYLLIAPCDGHVLEHIDELVSPDVPGQWSTSASAAAQSVIELLVQTARIVVEREYFDLDFRSEFSLTHETSFAVRSPDTLRLHLFMDEPEAGARLLEAVDQMAASYAGYVNVTLPDVGWGHDWFQDPRRFQYNVMHTCVTFSHGYIERRRS